MKFLLAALLAVSASAISPSSSAGKHLLSHARKLEDVDNGEFVNDWVADYSIKFQGCHAIKQWNEDAQGEDDVRIATTRLVRFRLCPSDACSDSKATGCTNSYGDYIVEIDTFMEAWMEAKQQSIEEACQKKLNSCGCDNGDENGEYCEYNCFVDAGMTECVDRNPYEEDNGQQQAQFNLKEYMECKKLDAGNDDGVVFYVGPHCSEQGGAISLQVFTDDACTEVSEQSFASLMGYELPFSTESIVDSSCLSCKEIAENENQNDAYDQDQVREGCEALYKYAGKCESNLPSSTASWPNTNACTYLEGVKIIRQNGIIDTGSSRASATATAFIVILAMAFCAMTFYVWYLRTRLGVKANSLL